MQLLGCSSLQDLKAVFRDWANPKYALPFLETASMFGE
jgi:hypothetical protein